MVAEIAIVIAVWIVCWVVGGWAISRSTSDSKGILGCILFCFPVSCLCMIFLPKRPPPGLQAAPNYV